MVTKKQADKEEKEPSFEEALTRIEKIVSEMEEGTLNLDDMIGRFEEGQELIAFCGKKLNEVERKIEKLVKRGDALATEPFEGEAGESADGPTLF
jgi:exodeoxyribonuclease VII small subunit